jgi:hypothetical protein
MPRITPQSKPLTLAERRDRAKEIDNRARSGGREHAIVVDAGLTLTPATGPRTNPTRVGKAKLPLAYYVNRLDAMRKNSGKGKTKGKSKGLATGNEPKPPASPGPGRPLGEVSHL